MFVNNTAFFGLLILSGANIAIEKLPLVIQKISYALPLTRGINAARAIVAGTPIEEIIPMMSIEIVIGVAYATLGFLLFRTFEHQAKKRGTLYVI